MNDTIMNLEEIKRHYSGLSHQTGSQRDRDWADAAETAIAHMTQEARLQAEKEHRRKVWRHIRDEYVAPAIMAGAFVAWVFCTMIWG